MNTKIVANVKILAMTVLLNICFTSTSLCAPITPPESASPSNIAFASDFSDADLQQNSSQPVTEGATVSKVSKAVKPRTAKK